MGDLWTEQKHITVDLNKDRSRIILKITSPFSELPAELTPDEARGLATMLRRAARAVEAEKAKR